MRLRYWLLILAMCLYNIVSAQINVENVLIMGRRAISVDDYLTSIHYFNQVIEARPTDYRAFYYRAYAKFSLEDYMGAELDCNRSIEINPYITEVYQLRGLCRIHLKKYEEAIKDYTYVIKDFPDDQGAYYNRALCRLEMNDLDEADADMSIILKKWKNFHRAYMIKAQILFEKKDTLTGLVWVDSLLKISPQEAAAWAFKGGYALNKNSYKEADSCLSIAIGLNPNDYNSYVARAQARHGLNRFGHALEDYDKALEIVPEHFVAHYNRGLLRALVGDDNRAIEDFNFVLGVDPENTLAIYNRALLREQTGDYQGAIHDYTQILETYPNFLYGYIARGQCRRKVGDIKGAIEDETIAAKTQLDMTFKPSKRRPIKKVRKPNEHNIEQYQELVKNEPDSSQRYVSELFGKVQNKQVDRTPLPMFTLNFSHYKNSNAYKSVVFLPEIDRINQMGFMSFLVSLEIPDELSCSNEEIESIRVLLENQIENSPQHELLFLLSISYTKLYDYDTALKHINEAIQLAPKTYLYHLQRSLIYAAMQRNETKLVEQEADKSKGNDMVNYNLFFGEIDNTIPLAENSAVLYFNRACAKHHIGDINGAFSDYSTCIELDRKMPEAYYNRGILYLQTQQFDAAIADLSKAGEFGLYKAYNLLKQARREQSITQEKK